MNINVIEIISTENPQKKLNRKMSVCCESQVPEEHVSSHLRVDAIPPLPLFALLAADTDSNADNEDATTNASHSNESNSNGVGGNGGDSDEELHLDLSTKSDEEEEADELGAGAGTYDEYDEEEKQRVLAERKREREKLELKRSLLSSSRSLAAEFDARTCQLLNEYLTSTAKLSELTSMEQTCLVALADTVANVRCDVTFSSSNSSKASASSTSTSAQKQQKNNATNSGPIVDNCGLKFLLAVRSYNYLLRTLPTTQRDKLAAAGLGTLNYAWAFHSESESELIKAIAGGGDTAGNDDATTDTFQASGKSSIVILKANIP